MVGTKMWGRKEEMVIIISYGDLRQKLTSIVKFYENWPWYQHCTTGLKLLLKTIWKKKISQFVQWALLCIINLFLGQKYLLYRCLNFILVLSADSTFPTLPNIWVTLKWFWTTAALIVMMRFPINIQYLWKIHTASRLHLLVKMLRSSQDTLKN